MTRTTPAFTLTPGPAGTTPATLAALSQPIPRRQDPPFLALYAETVELPRRAVGAAADAGAAVEAALGEDPLYASVYPNCAGQSNPERESPQH